MYNNDDEINANFDKTSLAMDWLKTGIPANPKLDNIELVQSDPYYEEIVDMFDPKDAVRENGKWTKNERLVTMLFYYKNMYETAKR